MKIVVTGRNGYIGSQFINYALSQKHQIIVASRLPHESVPHWLKFDINSTAPVILPGQVDAIVHLAAFTSPGENEQHEIMAARSLIAASKKAEAKFIFVSSQTARRDAPTAYGRTKWCIEQDVLRTGGFVVRFGQVYGGPERGLFGELVSLVRNLHILPAFMPSPMVQPIHVDDCAQGLLRLAELKDIDSGVYNLASQEPVTFTKFLHTIAKKRIRVCRIFLPIPVFMIKLGSGILGKKLAIKAGLYRLNSLFDLPEISTASDLEVIGLRLRPLSSGMHLSGCENRRRLINESIALFTYILRQKPNSAIIRRYVRVVEKLSTGIPLDLPTLMLAWPASLALLDSHTVDNSPQCKEFIWRLDAATSIAEASKRGAFRFIGSTKAVFQPVALFLMASAISSELVWRALRLLLPSRLLKI